MKQTLSSHSAHELPPQRELPQPFLNPLPRETAPIPGSPPKDTDATGYTVNVFAIIIFYYIFN